MSPGAVKADPSAVEDHYGLVKTVELWKLNLERWRLTLEVCMLTLEPWRGCEGSPTQTLYPGNDIFREVLVNICKCLNLPEEE